MTLLRTARRVLWRTTTKSWGDSIFAKAATAAFWQTLSLPPLLLGVLGSLGYVGGWFGPDTVDIIHAKIIAVSRDAFSANVVDELISPTVNNVLQQGRADIVSVGFLLSLWAGSSAMSTFVDSIVEAHGQQDARHPVWQRIFALLLYAMFLVVSVFILPLVAIGPTLAGRTLPPSWREIGLDLIDSFYYPGVGLLLLVGLTTLYKLALHKTLPWHRLLGGALLAGMFFMAASAGLRWYLGWIARTGVSYGALATPIAFLLFTFFLGFSVVLGAEFNATIQEFWPASTTRLERAKRKLFHWGRRAVAEAIPPLAAEATPNGATPKDARHEDDPPADAPPKDQPAQPDAVADSADDPNRYRAGHSPLRSPS